MAAAARSYGAPMPPLPPPIRQLPEAVANQIAAGEVLERPAAAVKELAENSLDAGATRIVVRLEDGGRRLVEVEDDGHGMRRDDLPLALARHATSKLTSADDLFRIATLGFRGEALPSIAAVSEFALASRPADQEQGWRLRLEGGARVALEPCAMACGTRVSVRNLFWNVPARLKFLKTEAAEAGHVTDQVMRLALSHPRVAFRLETAGESGARTVIDQPAGETLDLRVRALFGRQFAERLLPVAAHADTMQLAGFIAHPQEARPTAKRQYVFLNGRFVRDKLLLAAVREGFKGFLEPRLHGAVFLHLDLDPGLVDVNVHPTKSEVRFRREGEVFTLVRNALQQALGAGAGGFSLLGGGAGAVGIVARTVVRPAPEPAAPPAYQERFLPQTPAPSAPWQARTQETPEPGTRVADTGTGYESAARSDAPAAAAASSSAPLATRDPQPAARSSPSGAATASSTHLPGVRRVVQLNRMYLLIETDRGIRLVDQHALHEKALFLCLDPGRHRPDRRRPAGAAHPAHRRAARPRGRRARGPAAPARALRHRRRGLRPHLRAGARPPRRAAPPQLVRLPRHPRRGRLLRRRRGATARAHRPRPLLPRRRQGRPGALHRRAARTGLPALPPRAHGALPARPADHAGPSLARAGAALPEVTAGTSWPAGCARLRALELRNSRLARLGPLFQLTRLPLPLHHGRMDHAARDLCTFIDAAPSPAHAAQALADRLLAAGFHELDARAPEWHLAPGRFLVRRGATVIAFILRGAAAPQRFRLIGAHTDSPHLRLKPRAAYHCEGCRQFGVEVYGGALLNSWLDRDLGLAGTVHTADGARHLVRLHRPLARVAQLAIHLDRKIGEDGLKLNPQLHLAPLWGLAGDDQGGKDGRAGKEEAEAAFTALLRSAGVPAGEVVAHDLALYDLTASTLGGAADELIFAPRLDNLASCHAGLAALLAAADGDAATVPVLACFDHEEVGSGSDTGADGPLLGAVLERIALERGLGRAAFLAALAGSTLLSADMAHAVAPQLRRPPRAAPQAAPGRRPGAEEQRQRALRHHRGIGRRPARHREARGRDPAGLRGAQRPRLRLDHRPRHRRAPRPGRGRRRQPDAVHAQRPRVRRQRRPRPVHPPAQRAPARVRMRGEGWDRRRAGKRRAASRWATGRLRFGVHGRVLAAAGGAPPSVPARGRGRRSRLVPSSDLRVSAPPVLFG